VVRKTIVAIILLVPFGASAAEITCKKSPALTGKCSTVKGSLGLTSGLGVTLESEDGTRFIIKAPPDSNADIVPVVMQNWLYWQTRTNSMKTRISGSFELCPLPPAVNMAGIKDFGCINQGTHITEDKASSPGN
jgi:hypothetical protein